jgi:putative peptide zinc metalloprotease protein
LFRPESGLNFGVVLGVTYAAILLHELGHAAACVSMGVEHGPIGACIYWVFPAFYTDTSSAWKLKRTQRLVVDGGGVYMTELVAAGATAAFWSTGDLTYAAIALVSDLQFLVSLVPSVRTDGYWFLCDLLGVQNLMSCNKEFSLWLAGRLVGVRRPDPKVFAVRPPWLRRLYFVYFAIFVCVLGGLTWTTATWYIPLTLRRLPGIVSLLSNQIVSGQVSWFTVLLTLNLLTASVVAIGIALYSVRGVRRLVAWRKA